ncbi:DUF6879 family protein [Streptomyces sp. NBC_00872]|uniref:DUF6879 family protein n=1 Tax=Streptomyces sp. NBC_00872 TaxID=2903686 RepID=UPI00386FF244|nr:hypothetical protein OG214_15655 [Streptomyces sp. NBC_00872]
MKDFVPATEILGFFEEGFEHTAWRLETRRDYPSDQATDEYKNFLRGIQPPGDTTDPWFLNVREQAARGKRIERVRLVDAPATDNQRYLLATTGDNIECGEDIRYMFRARAEQLGLPTYDFWLFDSRILARFNWNDASRRLELTTDPGEVVHACQARDAAWHHAIRYEEFGAGVTSPV